jgi:zinc transport system ATP-binding protein
MIHSITNNSGDSNPTSTTSSAVPVLDFNEVWFSYDGETAVQDITFSITRGEFMAVLGPNGSGKTTLLRLALGLLKPLRGEVRLFGQDPRSFDGWSRVGYVPQRVEAVQNRFPATAREVVSYGNYRGFDPLRLFRKRRAEKREIMDALDTVSISELADRRVSDMSVGQQQRVLIARALIRQPELLLLDEPVAGVDAAGQEAFHTLVRRLNKEMGMTVMLISHDIGAVMREATTCACINREIVFHGGVHDIRSTDLSKLYGFPVDVLLHDPSHTHR